MQLGVIGLGTMGMNLARNAARNGARVAVYNRTWEKTEEFMKQYGQEGEFVACKTYEDVQKALTPPRPVLLMVKAGNAVDDVIADLVPALSTGDILIDAGNSLYADTERREKELATKQLHFFGMGVSGGEEGALNGPSMMPGGDLAAYTSMEPLLKKMAASDGDGGTCVTHLGPGGAGHFVKMVHNGIEYGIMQLIAETYDVLKRGGQLTNAELAELFTQWNAGDDLGSFLVEITAQIFTVRDPQTGGELVDAIVDRAGQKGTGKWTTEAAMTLGVAIPTINAAVDARILSGDTAGRLEGQKFPGVTTAMDYDPKDAVQCARSALELSTLCAYLQGFALIRTASDVHGWNINLAEVSRIWRGGCIIRSVMLPLFQQHFAQGATGVIDRFSGERQQHWRQFISLGVSQGIPLSASTASLSYFDALRSTHLPTNLIQAQRDFFGAHTFERVDKKGNFHGEWGNN